MKKFAIAAVTLALMTSGALAQQTFTGATMEAQISDDTDFRIAPSRSVDMRTTASVTLENGMILGTDRESASWYGNYSAAVNASALNGL